MVLVSFIFPEFSHISLKERFSLSIVRLKLSLLCELVSLSPTRRHKCGGDLRRKDELEPYAYWPLDRKMMSRRPQQRAAARKGMSSVVKMTKKYEGKSASGVLSIKSLKLKKKGSKKKIKAGNKSQFDAVKKKPKILYDGR
ncbi:hypothetical protein Ahy_A06g027900 [Arachis hypogaea]|uniref:Uncharacterized protein n=1 Tax=Arachis hypogaea TaxID=3818 RepID=A0A445CQ22_ARAHY|nr:hypothetical protein Ahy_A06g027900 [Arachis hypogaea]